MTNRFKLNIPMLTTAVLLALPMTMAQAMSKTEYQASQARIEAQLKVDKATCSPMTGNAQDVCNEQAKAKDKVGRAELEASYTGKASDKSAVLVAKAESAYAVSKEQCDDQAGNAKDVCVEQAKSVKTKSLAEVKLTTQMVDASKTAVQSTLDADYNVAAEKCEAMAGDSKAACLTSAKTKYGKL